jgi:hypothetical protein
MWSMSRLHVISVICLGLDTMYTVRGVRGLGMNMLTLDTKMSLYSEDQGLQVVEMCIRTQ